MEPAGLLPSLFGSSCWHFRLTQVLQAPSKPAQALWLNRSVCFALPWLGASPLKTQAELKPCPILLFLLFPSIQGADGSFEGFMEAPRMELPQAPNGIMSLVYQLPIPTRGH